MRNNANRTIKSRGHNWVQLCPRARVVVDHGLADFGVASRTHFGVTLTVFTRFTGRLIRQVNYSWEVLGCLTPAVRERIFMNFFKKPPTGGVPVGSSGEDRTPKDLKERAPTLGHFLCDGAWPDGSIRQTSSLVVFVQDGMFKACLGDKDSNTSLWASSRSFDELLESLECRLTDEQPDWRRSRPKGKKS